MGRKHTTMRALSIPVDERPELIIQIEEVALNTYHLVRGAGTRIVSKVLFPPLRFVALIFEIIFKLAVSVVSVFVLVGLLAVIILLLCYGNALFYLMKPSFINNLNGMDRGDLMNRHLRYERSLRTLNSLKHSKFLFKTPILGQLNTTFLNNISILEAESKKLAYPNIASIPNNLTVHEHNPCDSWQIEADSDIYERIYMR